MILTTRCFSLPPRFIGLMVYLAIGIPLTGYSQISPFTVGEEKSAIRTHLATTRSARGLVLSEESADLWKMHEEDESGYELDIEVNFEDAKSQKILTEWTAKTIDYRIILRQWFDETNRELDVDQGYERDPRMEEMLANSYKTGRSKVAVYVSADRSQRIILVFHATQEGAFLSHMHQAYFWPEE